MKHAYSALAVLCAAAGLHACNADATDDGVMNPDDSDDANGTDTGNPYEDDGNGEGTAGGGCTEDESEVDPSTPTSLGFAPQAVLDLVTGEHTSSLAWLASDTAYGPEMGLSEITLDITPIGAPIFVDREVQTSTGNGEEGGLALGEIYSPCNDLIRLNVSIEVTTTGGALDEVVETTIEASAADFASGSFSIELSAINGSFEATPTAPPNFLLTKSSLRAQLGFSEYGSVGGFTLSSEFRSIDGGVAGVGGATGQGPNGEIAHFPADNYCGPAAVSVTADQTVRGLSMAQALDDLNAMSPDEVRYQSGAPSQLTLAFTSAEERVCARFDQEYYGGSAPGTNMTLEFPGVVRVISTDGRIDGTLPLQITTSSEGGLQSTTAQTNFDYGSTSQPAEVGIQDDVDFSAYDGVFVQFLTTIAADSSGGSLRAYGLQVADCVNNQPPPDPDQEGAMGGGSSGGCAGTERIPVWSAFWGDWDATSQ